MDFNLLAQAAITARENAYAPYSGFAVGAALLTAEGKVYTGCNIENAAYSPGNCAERTAIFKAVSEGERQFTAIAIAAGKALGELAPAAPCGVCRQVMREFCADDFKIIIVTGKTEYKETTLGELFPESFGPDNLA